MFYVYSALLCGVSFTSCIGNGGGAEEDIIFSHFAQFSLKFCLGMRRDPATLGTPLLSLLNRFACLTHHYFTVRAKHLERKHPSGSEMKSSCLLALNKIGGSPPVEPSRCKARVQRPFCRLNCSQVGTSMCIHCSQVTNCSCIQSGRLSCLCSPHNGFMPDSELDFFCLTSHFLANDVCNTCLGIEALLLPTRCRHGGR